MGWLVGVARSLLEGVAQVVGEETGLEAKSLSPLATHQLPDGTVLHCFSAYVVGEAHSANDPDDFIKAEIDWIGVPLRERKPYLGICLGAQMLARHMGERVFTHPEGKAEVGYYQVRPTQAGRAICDWPDHQYQWHREGFDLPTGCELLAEGDIFRTQAFRVGKTIYGLQFHLEVTPRMIERWIEERSKDLALAPYVLPDKIIADTQSYAPALKYYGERFLTEFVRRVARSRHQQGDGGQPIA